MHKLRTINFWRSLLSRCKMDCNKDWKFLACRLVVEDVAVTPAGAFQVFQPLNLIRSKVIYSPQHNQCRERGKLLDMVSVLEGYDSLVPGTIRLQLASNMLGRFSTTQLGNTARVIASAYSRSISRLSDLPSL